MGDEDDVWNVNERRKQQLQRKKKRNSDPIDSPIPIQNSREWDVSADAAENGEGRWHSERDRRWNHLTYRRGESTTKTQQVATKDEGRRREYTDLTVAMGGWVAEDVCMYLT